MNAPAKRSAGPAVPNRAGEDPALAARLRRSGWLIGLLALGFYVGFIAWNLLRTQGG